MKTTTAREVLRRCRFRISRGYSFSLTLWDAGQTDHYGKSRLAYRLTMSGPDMTRTTIFQGDDFYVPAPRSTDSDEVVRSIMNFLTLRPGDTDLDYFAGYTEAQRGYCDQHAEELAMVVMDRFGED